MERLFDLVTGGRGLHPGRLQFDRTVDDGAILRVRPRYDSRCRDACGPNADGRATGKEATTVRSHGLMTRLDFVH